VSKISGVRVAGVSAAVPKNRVTVRSLELFADELEADRFSKVTGIHERRVATDGIFSSDLASPAIDKLITSLSWTPADIGVLIVITQTPDHAAPGVGMKLHGEMGFPQQCIVFDINIGCSSFPNGLAVAMSLMKELGIKKGLLVIVDLSSRLCHPVDKATFPLFGDAGAAIALCLDDEAETWFDINTDGKGYEAIIVKAGGLSSRHSPIKNCSLNDAQPSPWHMHMDGSKVFSFAINYGPKTIGHVIAESGMVPELVFLHQANKLINSTIQKKLNLPNAEFPMSLGEFGNTSSVTIPLTFVTNFGGTVLNNKVVLAAGFGVGLSWGSVLFAAKNLNVTDLVEI
jgi:3-oxoacyl-[acyl-carrier-protein] synthase III